MVATIEKESIDTFEDLATGGGLGAEVSTIKVLSIGTTHNYLNSDVGANGTELLANQDGEFEALVEIVVDYEYGYKLWAECKVSNSFYDSSVIISDKQSTIDYIESGCKLAFAVTDNCSISTHSENTFKSIIGVCDGEIDADSAEYFLGNRFSFDWDDNVLLLSDAMFSVLREHQIPFQKTGITKEKVTKLYRDIRTALITKLKLSSFKNWYIAPPNKQNSNWLLVQ